MTEKRFRIYQDIYEVFYIEDIQHYSDKKLQKGYKIGHEEDVKYEDVLKVVDLLNALHEEKEYWKSKYKQEVEKHSIITARIDKNGNWHRIPKE